MGLRGGLGGKQVRERSRHPSPRSQQDCEQEGPAVPGERKGG